MNDTSWDTPTGIILPLAHRNSNLYFIGILFSGVQIK